MTKIDSRPLRFLGASGLFNPQGIAQEKAIRNVHSYCVLDSAAFWVQCLEAVNAMSANAAQGSSDSAALYFKPTAPIAARAAKARQQGDFAADTAD